MTAPSVRQFAGILPNDGEPATFPGRAQALWGWQSGELAPDMQAAIDWINAATTGQVTSAAALPANNVDSATEGFVYFGYGGTHANASGGDNPFPALDGVFLLTVAKAGIGAAGEYVVQTAIVADSEAAEIVQRAKAIGGWSTWYRIGGNTPAAGVFRSLTVQDAENTILRIKADSGFSAVFPKGSGTNPAYLFMGNETTGETGRVSTDNNGLLSFWTGTGGTVDQQVTLDANGLMTLLYPTMKLGGAYKRAYRTTLADDAVLNFSTPGAVGMALVVVDNGGDYPDAHESALFFYDTGGSPYSRSISIGSSVAMDQENSDGFLNIKLISGHYIRLTNKLGGSKNISVFTWGGDGA